MRDLAQGFLIDDRFVPWGTLLADAAGQFRLDPDDPSFTCRSACGFPALCGTLDGPAPDRPVLGISVELAPPAKGHPGPEHWAGPLTAALGAPASADRWEANPDAGPGDCVVYSATWPGAGFSVALSVYGGLRTVEGGGSAGMLWVSWDEALAARPFLPEWLERCTVLERCAARLSSFHAYGVAEDLHPSLGDGSVEQRGLRLCLYQPATLATPAAVAAKLNPRRFALWTAASEGAWGLSSRWDTRMFRLGEPVEIGWDEVLPAKGGGYSLLRADDWSVRSSGGSREIKAAAEALREIAGVTVKFTEDYDC